LTSRRRLELIYKWNMEDAYERARWESTQDADLLDAFPAQELVRVESRRNTRDWQGRWQAEGGTLYEGSRMIATKNDPIWVAISRFGKPWPPFDFGSGMGVADVSREEAEALGVLGPDDFVDPVDPAAYTETLNLRVGDLSPAHLDRLRAEFGDQITIQDGTLRWSSAA